MSDTTNHALPTGRSVGQYEIVSFIGAGGMGEVYRAHDRRLRRDVAIKMLPAEYGADTARTHRFQQEARTTGRINHPNVVSVFDAGEQDGRPFIVSELLQGDTLRSYLQSRNRMPVRKVLEYGIQIARGLAAAHERGIVHRDLTPANIFVTSGGHLKILDFGLAKLTRAECEGATDTETASFASTPGTVLGTAAYMAPEQVEARPADHRCDIFALGVILYEMISGARPFAGLSPIATMSAILKDQPRDITALRPDVPPAVASVVKRCLEKAPQDRFQSARDLAFTLEELTTRSDVSLTSAALAAIRSASDGARRKPVLGLTTVAAVIAIVIAIATTDSRSGAEEAVSPLRPLERATWQLSRVTSSGRVANDLDLSPDARYVVHGSLEGLALVHVPTQSSMLLVAGAVGEAYGPRFSPDGNWVYFGRSKSDGSGDLYRVPILGGDPQLIAPRFDASLTFARDGGRIAFVRNDEAKNESTLVIASSDGSAETVLVRRGYDVDTLLACTWSPDGIRFLCNALAGKKAVMLDVDARSGAQRTVEGMRYLTDARWLHDGSGVVGIDQQVWRITYPVLTESRLTNDLSSYIRVAPSADGRTIAAIRMDVTTNLWALSLQDGTMRQITTGMNTYDGNLGVTVTPQGRIVWASRASGKGTNLMSSRLDGSDRRQLTFGDANDSWPHASPDGRFVLFQRKTADSFDIRRVGTDGSDPVRISEGVRANYSGDGKKIYFTRVSGETPNLYEMPAAGGEPRLFDTQPLVNGKPSPDGKWLLVGAGNGSVLRPLDGGSNEVPLPDVPPAHRYWRPDGRAIAFARVSAERSMNLFVKEIGGGVPRQFTRFKTGESVAWGLAWTTDGTEIVFARRNQARDVVVLERTDDNEVRK